MHISRDMFSIHIPIYIFIYIYVPFYLSEHVYYINAFEYIYICVCVFEKQFSMLLYILRIFNLHTCHIHSRILCIYIELFSPVCFSIF